MKIKQRIILWSLRLLSLFLMVGIPFYSLYSKIILGQEIKTKISFMYAIIIGVLGFILFKVLKRRYDRKLQSIDTANELGVIGTTPIILKRALLLIEVGFPLIVFSLFLYGLEQMRTLETPSHSLFLGYLWWFLGGLAILITHDYLKAYYYKQNEIDNYIQREEKVALRKSKPKKRSGGVFR